MSFLFSLRAHRLSLDVSTNKNVSIVTRRNDSTAMIFESNSTCPRERTTMFRCEKTYDFFIVPYTGKVVLSAESEWRVWMTCMYSSRRSSDTTCQTRRLHVQLVRSYFHLITSFFTPNRYRHEEPEVKRNVKKLRDDRKRRGLLATQRKARVRRIHSPLMSDWEWYFMILDMVIYTSGRKESIRVTLTADVCSSLLFRRAPDPVSILITDQVFPRFFYSLKQVSFSKRD